MSSLVKSPKKIQKFKKKINFLGALDQAARRRGRLFQKNPMQCWTSPFWGKIVLPKNETRIWDKDSRNYNADLKFVDL
jgi:hypothetical protein